MTLDKLILRAYLDDAIYEDDLLVRASMVTDDKLAMWLAEIELRDSIVFYGDFSR